MSNIDAASRSSPALFITDHLSLASYLLSRGHEPTLTATGSATTLFTFAASDDLTADGVAFKDGRATVEPTAYGAARIALRQQMDALKGGVR